VLIALRRLIATRAVPGQVLQGCRSILRELRRLNSEEQHEQGSAQNDLMFFIVDCPSGRRTKCTLSILIGQLSGTFFNCLINAETVQVVLASVALTSTAVGD